MLDYRRASGRFRSTGLGDDAQESFADRADAGRRLAALLRDERPRRPVVLALPRGGVPVAYEIARALEAPLDVFLVRKIGAPGHPELGVGAVAQGGVSIVNERAVQLLGITPTQIEAIAARERAELERRLQRYRGDRPLPSLAGRAVILVDDGLATGVSAAAAIRALRRLDPARIVLAVPVCAPETAESLRSEVDAVVCALAPEDFLAVGYWYRRFEQTTDEEVVDLLERARAERQPGSSDGGRRIDNAEVTIGVGGAKLTGDISLPSRALGIVLFAHGSGSSRHSPRNRRVAEYLDAAGLGTLLLDLLTTEEERQDVVTGRFRFDIGLLADRLVAAIDWLSQQEAARGLPLGCFGASTGAAAALIAAAERPEQVSAVVSRGGRPDLAGKSLTAVQAPVLLIVGGADGVVLDLNRRALRQMTARSALHIIPGATHLFEEPGALDEVARLAAEWFTTRLQHTPAQFDAAR